MAKDKNKHLECVLKSHNIENDEDLMKAYRAKRDEVRDDLKLKYAGDIYLVIHSGSYKKNTAINIKFDMDLVLPFKKGTDSLKNLYDELYSYFNTEYREKDSTLFEVKKQKVAIGLKFMVDGRVLDLDIVPGREINEYEKDNDLNLYVNDTMGLFPAGTSLKTNIQKQINNIRDNSVARDFIKLLKIWKRRNNGQMKSFVIELITVKAMAEYSGDSDRWSKLKHCLEYVRDNIQTVKLVDPGNNNNVVSDSLDDNQKYSISESMKWILESIDSDDSAIETHFPVNADFPCEEKSNVYIVSPERKPDKLNSDDFG